MPWRSTRRSHRRVLNGRNRSASSHGPWNTLGLPVSSDLRLCCPSHAKKSWQWAAGLSGPTRLFGSGHLRCDRLWQGGSPQVHHAALAERYGWIYDLADDFSVNLPNEQHTDINMPEKSRRFQRNNIHPKRQKDGLFGTCLILIWAVSALFLTGCQEQASTSSLPTAPTSQMTATMTR
jgi:hypothetical protein